ncbi:hypothetical protein DPX16_0817 [Anabarilius grahami]|uniref:Integrase core domain-containing protein n=1 Tax=Anabarilius grahami TaxID=495550 RepID=A0A3N0XW33_ANAGA|nr:hypothetical protein DPX16_0817 [Anabarilius grahami]
MEQSLGLQLEFSLECHNLDMLYGLVIFGGIDGYSRKVMYLRAATNNRAETALGFFLEAVGKHKFPHDETYPLEENTGVVVPQVDSPLSEYEMEHLRTTINPVSESRDFGQDIYLSVFRFVQQLVQ